MMILRKGDSSPLVGAVQQQLLEAGFAIPLGVEDNVYGDATYRAILAFQAGHVGPDGHPLAEDGVCGPNTMWSLAHGGTEINGSYTAKGWHCTPSQVREAVRPVVEAAVGEIGNFEFPDRSNGGPTIDKYGQRQRAWCAFFLSWLFNRLPSGSPFGVIGSAWGLYDWAVAHGRVLEAGAVPLPGDVFVLLREKDPVTNERHGHTGLVVSTEISDTGLQFSSVDGNASNAVRGLVRRRDAVSAILRPVPLV